MANKNKDKKYHFLYKTTNKLNGKVYYGIHSTNNIEDGYLGSGSYLYRSIKKYGRENFQREILKFFDTREDLVKAEKELVTEDLVKDPNCYNTQIGGEGWNSTNTVSVKDKNGFCFRVHKDDPRYLSGELKHVSTGQVTVIDNYGNTFNVYIDDDRYLKGELKSITCNHIIVKDKNGNRYRIHKNDQKYISGEYVHYLKNTVYVIDTNGKKIRVEKNSEEAKTLQLWKWPTGRIVTDETKEKLRNIDRRGSKNSQHGTMWITNGKENKKIKKEEKIPVGWTKGRKMNI